MCLVRGQGADDIILDRRFPWERVLDQALLMSLISIDAVSTTRCTGSDNKDFWR
jgi:hypothetical protein